MKDISFHPVTDAASIRRTAALAAEIWREHYTPIIGAAQVEYMIDKFQSAQAIEEQIGEGYRYFLARDGQGREVGYCAVVPRENELFLSKLYVICGARGRGFGRRMVAFVEDLARELKLTRITLTVNRNNSSSLAAYRRMGFNVEKSVVAAIGNGFVMDDYALAKKI